MLLGILQEYIKADLNLTDFQLGLLGGPAFVILYCVSGIPIARYAERANRISIISIGAAVWSAATATCGLAQNFVQLGLSRIAVGIGEAACIPPSHSTITDYFPQRRRATALAVFGLGIPIGTLVAALVGGFIAERFGWRAAFFLLGIPGIIFALLLKLTVTEPPRRGDRGGAPSMPDTVRFLLSKRSFILVTLGGSLVGIFAFAISHFMVSYLVCSFDLRVDQAAPIFGLIMAIGSALGIFQGGALADKLSSKHPRVLSWLPALCIAASIPLYLIGFFQTALPMTLAFIFLGTMLHYFNMTPMFTIAQNVAEPRMRATSSALLLTIVTLVGYGLGPPLAGAVADFVGGTGGYGLRVAFSLGLVFLVASLVCYWLAGRTLIDGFAERTPEPDASR